ncbi:MAG: nucleotide sugar dehydrogenase [Acidobacteria bacterium]|nr:nucleotide sugar dehydrogenase [Acidobacteriota bacterium]
MRVLTWGLGYVGLVSSACLAQLGHDVIGIDSDIAKVQALNQGKSILVEPGCDEIVSRNLNAGRLKGTVEADVAANWPEILLVCVGTPGDSDGNFILDDLNLVTHTIGNRLRQSTSFQVVVVRSTVFPGTTREILIPQFEKYSGKKAGEDFGVVFNPEFLRESTAIKDFFEPPYILIGELDARSGRMVELLYEPMNANRIRVSLEEAECLKLASNAFHSLKVGFANEIGRLCDRLTLDSQKVMDLVCADTRLNLSSAYLNPGFAFGGACLPKDLRSLTAGARHIGVELPILEAVLPSNDLHLEMVLNKVTDHNLGSVGVLGLSFKSGTNDLRESPAVEFVCRLRKKGVMVWVFDPDVKLSRLTRANKEFLMEKLPDIETIVCPDINLIQSRCEGIVVTRPQPEFQAFIRHIRLSHPQIPVINFG